MKVSKKTLYMLIGVIGVLALLIAYLWIYIPLLEQADVLKAQNDSLGLEVTDLQSKMENRNVYLEETKKMNEEMKTIMDMFPVELREEDAILLTLSEESLAPTTVVTLTMDETEQVVFDEEDSSDTSEAENNDPANTTDTTSVGLYRNPVSMQFVAEYGALKRYVKSIAQQENRTKIVGLTAAYDETTGMLSCVANLNMYFVTGQEDKTYVQPDFSSVLTGTENPFGTISITTGEGDGDSELAEDVEGLGTGYGAGRLVGDN